MVELGARRRDQVGVAMAEVQRRVGGQHVQVALALDVGDPGALGVGDDHGQRVVVVRRVPLHELDLRAGRVLEQGRCGGELLVRIGHRRHGQDDTARTPRTNRPSVGQR